VIKRVKWPVDWNRPLSREEREVAKRLEMAPKEPFELPKPLQPQKWHNPVTVDE
jgi:hypothetical protein